jgi:hypothetical protein
MKFLKGFGLAILSLLLFLSLSVFGMAFMLKSTLLNPHFVAAEVDRIDVPALTRELTETSFDQGSSVEEPFFKDALYQAVSDLEPQLKEQLHSAIYSGYDYLLGHSDRLNIVISLEELKAGVKDSLWQTFSDYLASDITTLPGELVRPYLEQHAQDLLKLIPSNYLPPELAVLSSGQLGQYLAQNYQELAAQIPPEVLASLADQLKDPLRPYFDQYYQDLVKDVPDEYTVDESSLPPEAVQTMAQVKQVIGYFQTYYYVLIGFMVLLVGLIILINRSVRGTTRDLGIDFLIYGAVELAGVYIARNFLPTGLPLSDMPSSLQTWVTALSVDILSPLQTFSIGLMVAGAVLIVVSFVYKPAAAED